MFRKLKELFTRTNKIPMENEFNQGGQDEGFTYAQIKYQLVGADIQWTQGQNKGILQTIASFGFDKGVEYVYFTDGNRAPEAQFNLAFEVVDKSNPLTDPITNMPMAFLPSTNYKSIEQIRCEAEGGVWVPPAPAAPALPAPVVHTIQPDLTQFKPSGISVVEVTPTEQAKSPLQILLEKQSKSKRIVKLSLELEIPDPATMKILKSSFENFDEDFAAWLQSDDAILQAILTELQTRLIKA